MQKNILSFLSYGVVLLLFFHIVTGIKDILLRSHTLIFMSLKLHCINDPISENFDGVCFGLLKWTKC